MAAALEDNLWLEMATAANTTAARLAAELRERGAGFLFEPQANMIFCNLPRRLHQKLHDAGAIYYVWEGSLEGDDPEEPLAARLVTNWATTEADVDRFLGVFG